MLIKIGKIIVVVSISIIPIHQSHAITYICPAYKKTGLEKDYTKSEIKYWRYTTKLQLNGGKAWVSRCSIETGKGFTCDRYQADKIVTDKYIGVKKFYFFKSQFDFQLFKSMLGVENNGRGSIQYSKCIIVKS